MSHNGHRTANRHFRGSRGGRLASKLGGKGRRTPLWKLRRLVVKLEANTRRTT